MTARETPLTSEEEAAYRGLVRHNPDGYPWSNNMAERFFATLDAVREEQDALAAEVRAWRAVADSIGHTQRKAAMTQAGAARAANESRGWPKEETP